MEMKSMDEKMSKAIESIGKLIEITRNGKLQWISIDPDSVNKEYVEEQIESAFRTKYNNKFLRLYKRTYPITINTSFSFVTASKEVMRNEVKLEIVDQFQSVLWSFPTTEILNDLLNTVQYQCSGAKDIIDSLLDE